jgi:stage III sporulation protein AH
MTKKQVGIIFTLLALIICTALLAQKLNTGGLNDPTDISAVLAEDNLNDENNAIDETETMSTQDFFNLARSEREQKDAVVVQNLNELIDNQNTVDEQKVDATKELQKIILKQDKQKTVELNIKNKGYEDVLCEISEDQSKASVIVRADDLDEKAGAVIQEIVQNASNIKEISIELKK